MAFLSLVSACLLFFALYTYSPFLLFKVSGCVIVHPNQKFEDFALDLKEKATYFSLGLFKLYAKLIGLDQHLQVGEYCFSRHTSLAGVIFRLKHGKRELHKFTVVDGWTYSEMIQQLNKASMLNISSHMNDPAFVAQALNVEKNSLEGNFYPSTYYYAYPDTALHVLAQAHLLMQKKIAYFYSECDDKVSVASPEILLIMASIIQKEANDPEEQRIIAGIINNRLKHHMKLQIDATVLYGLNRYSLSNVRLNKQDLQTDTAYNTYLHLGLPPTPICMPGETAFYAVAHPHETSYLYYVSKKNGKHQFSETLEEHNKAVYRYWLSNRKEGTS
ncbi:MAG: endolytic transglycosylase MltG [Gammaproteobacteria bacterium]|nr:endolytic transglycosylase MltG [Gammaproteobacteria bacterium]